VEATKQKEEKRKKPEPKEKSGISIIEIAVNQKKFLRKGMPQHQHCPPEKRRGDKNPECR
jgi:hypothetical protein